MTRDGMFSRIDTLGQIDATRRHFEEQVQIYGDTSLVSLINHKGHEKPVKEAFEQGVIQVRAEHTSIPQTKL